MGRDTNRVKTSTPFDRVPDLKTVTGGLISKGQYGLVPTGDGGFTYKRFQLTTTALVAPEDMSEAEWEDMGDKLLAMEGSIQWLLGDWLALSDNRTWGDTYQRLALKYDLEVDTLWHYALVCRAVKNWIRNPVLSFAHHRLVAGMKDKQTKEPLTDEQQHWLNTAALNGWSVKQLREAIHPTAPPDSEHQRNVQLSLEKLGRVQPSRIPDMDITKAQVLLSHVEIARRHLETLETALLKRIE